ncbi:hypothetical protein A2U01_0112365 [Trifolium medium]|uniref:Uncharacterized protein n=1 Tax=Trifolium medium TaxID=97028 RepID=A0A392VVT2_9FABA|nr:hypothetical protein [Trifolium medium]
MSLNAAVGDFPLLGLAWDFLSDFPKFVWVLLLVSWMGMAFRLVEVLALSLDLAVEGWI